MIRHEFSRAHDTINEILNEYIYGATENLPNDEKEQEDTTADPQKDQSGKRLNVLHRVLHFTPNTSNTGDNQSSK